MEISKNFDMAVLIIILLFILIGGAILIAKPSGIIIVNNNYYLDKNKCEDVFNKYDFKNFTYYTFNYSSYKDIILPKEMLENSTKCSSPLQCSFTKKLDGCRYDGCNWRCCNIDKNCQETLLYCNQRTRGKVDWVV